MIKTINESLKELFKNTSFDCYQYENFNTAEKLIEHIREEIDQEEVIYYSNAIEYLKNNDASLRDSLQLAHDCGYTADKINSELLATLLMHENLQQELSNLTSEIEEIFNN